MRIVGSSVCLLRSVVVERNTSSGQGIDESRAEGGLVSVLAEVSAIVVVVNEDAECVDILEVTFLLIESVADLGHIVTLAEYVLDGVVHGIIEHTSHVLLVWADIGGISVKGLTHLENTGSLAVLRPKVLWYVRDGIDSDSIESVIIDEVSNPVLEITSNPVVGLVEIWEISQSAVFDLPLVAPILDIAAVVVVLSPVERIDLAEVHTNWSDVVCDNINHDVDASLVAGIDHALQVIG